MEAKQKPKPIQDFTYLKAERRDGRVYYMKRCLHCKVKFESNRVSAVFCNEHCRKTHNRIKLHEV